MLGIQNKPGGFFMSRRYFLSPKIYYPDECGDLATAVIREESMQNQFLYLISYKDLIRKHVKGTRK
jgi:hypothetical protein